MGRGPKSAKGKAKSVIRRKSPGDQAATVPDLEKRLAEALRDKAEVQEQQAATAEILRVISSSPSDIQPVYDAIVRRALTLCRATLATVYRRDNDLVYLVGIQHEHPHAAEVAAAYPAPLTSSLMSCRAILENAVIHLPDVEADGALPPEGVRLARLSRFRSVVSVPLRRDGLSIGAILVGRPALGLFPEEQVALLQTFADQAVIAIENVRLFTETKDALERQTATAEILRVISSSPTDVQPVFDVIVEHACRLSEGVFANVVRFDGELMHNMAHHGFTSEGREAALRFFPARPTRASMSGRAILSGTVVYTEDARRDDELRVSRELSELMDFRAQISVPMLRDGTTVGAITVARRAPGRFPERQVALLKTFADQAVIAIENVRLFKELETRNRDLTTSLDRQTATAEILRVISGSRTDLQPVFDAILQSAVRLCGAINGIIWRVEDGLRRQRSLAGVTSPEWEAIVNSVHTGPPTEDTASGWVLATREVLHVPDYEREERFPRGREMARAMGYRSLLAVPMLRGQDPVGVILLNKAQPFDEGQIQLLRTFADQAVIAIENGRLLGELQARTAELTRSVGQLTALGEVGQAVSSSLDLETVLTTIVSRAVQLSGLDGGVVFEYDEAAEKFVQRAAIGTANRATAAREEGVRKGEGVVGRTALTLQPVQIPDISVAGAYEGRIREDLIAAGVRALVAVPILREGRLIGGLAVNRNQPGEFQPEMIDLLRTFATQSSLAIQNARLFRELADKSHQLEAASQHKSEFLANMSHELRTPLNAIIGFSEVLSDRMFGELNEKQEEYLKDIYASGTHLLSLINDILDLSKIEAGRMELELTEFDLPTAIENALMLVRERAGRRSLTLHTDIDDRLGQMHADERKVRQVVLNLLSNAIKFTPEGGRIEVGAVPKDGLVEVSVRDTGIGIAPEDQEKVFEEFRQVGTAEKKAEGTGLGLTLCRKFVELHGGKIWVKSQLGQGSTFTFTIPVRRGG